MHPDKNILSKMHGPRCYGEGVHGNTELPDLGVSDGHNSMKWAER